MPLLPPKPSVVNTFPSGLKNSLIVLSQLALRLVSTGLFYRNFKDIFWKIAKFRKLTVTTFDFF